jgi:hypothetical protein
VKRESDDEMRAKLALWKAILDEPDHSLAYIAPVAIEAIEAELEIRAAAARAERARPTWPRPEGMPEWSRYKSGEMADVFVQMAASAAVGAAIRRGELVRLPCEICGAEPAEGHHPSYAEDMWLNVTWLCDAHHRQLHMGMRSDQ